MKTGQRTLLAALVLAVAVLVGLTLHGLREDRAAASSSGAAEAPGTTSGAHAETPPWQTPSTTNDTLPPGTVPVSSVNPPAPDPSPPMPPAVVEPPNPATNRLPMDNPGGVNGDRPERPVD